MADIATIWNPAVGQGDWALSSASLGTITDENGTAILDHLGAPLTDGLLFTPANPGLLSGGDLTTAVLISLFTDAEAGADDATPDGNPRGWWAGPIGSKLWLRTRSKRTPTLEALVKSDIAAALQWLIEDGVAGAVDVTTQWQSPGRLGVLIVVTRTSGDRVSIKFDWAWKDI